MRRESNQMMNEQEVKDFVKQLVGQVDSSLSLEAQSYIYIDGVGYAFEMVDSEDITDEGKYQAGADIYEVVTKDEQKMGIFLMQPYTRYGDYWSGHEWDYEEPYQVEKKQKTVTYWG